MATLDSQNDKFSEKGFRENERNYILDIRFSTGLKAVDNKGFKYACSMIVHQNNDFYASLSNFNLHFI